MLRKLEKFKETGWFSSIPDLPGHVDMIGEKMDTWMSGIWQRCVPRWRRWIHD
jgi:hypothetical protein